MKIPFVMKKCNKCNNWLVANTYNFHKKNTGKYGLRSKCKNCRNKDRRNFYKNNKEYYKEYYRKISSK